jgi:NRAMP (natural resistance-associated macrophage protein)-like metal ion transporter
MCAASASAGEPLTHPLPEHPAPHHDPLLKRLGPGLISGAADDDPSGIATYSQAGAQFGTGLLWSSVLALPLLIAVQLASARLGRTTGRGLAANIRAHRTRPVLVAMVLLLLVANTVNIMADLAAMGDAVALLIGGRPYWYSLAFGVSLALAQLFLPYARLVVLFKWLTLALFAYVGVLLVQHVPWGDVLRGMLLPSLGDQPGAIMTVVAVLGTTISPYLFFWQAAQEAEDMAARGARSLLAHPDEAAEEYARTRLDTVVGMSFSALIAVVIMTSTAVSLHHAGVTRIETSAQAAEALRPLAGDLAFALFAAGIIGTGLLAVPVLAGSAAYAVAEAAGWRSGLRNRWSGAPGFYLIIVVATVGGTLLNVGALPAMRALYWSAVLNGVVSVPILALLMGLVSDPAVMGRFTVSRSLRAVGWMATGVMAFLVVLLGAHLLGG